MLLNSSGGNLCILVDMWVWLSDKTPTCMTKPTEFTALASHKRFSSRWEEPLCVKEVTGRINSHSKPFLAVVGKPWSSEVLTK